MAKYQDTPGSATEAQRLNFGYGQTALIESERIKRKNPQARGSLISSTACPNNPDDGQSLSRSLRRCARLDFYSLGGLRDFYGLIDVEVENSLVKVSVDSSILRFER
jgi:hypothetical protein